MRFARFGHKTVAAGVLTAAVLLGGCAQSPSDVAMVGADQITRDQYDSAVEVGGTLNVAADQVLSVMIVGAIAEQLATEQGIEITDGDRDQVINEAAPGALAQVPEARDFFYDDADRVIVMQQVGEDAFVEAVRAADVTVNPRFGSWDPEQSLQVIPGTGSLSVEAAR
jgi:hypothetical protein